MPRITIKQHDITDCGAACLASIGNHYKVNLPIARIRQFANTDRRGTNVLGMIEAAEKMGFTAKGVKGGMDAIDKIPLPAVAHIVALFIVAAVVVALLYMSLLYLSLSSALLLLPLVLLLVLLLLSC